MTRTTTQPGRSSLAARTRPTITLTGVQPTGELHLGNYIGAIRPLADLAADPARDVYVFVADLHALNSRPEPAVLRERSRRLVAALLACGLDRPVDRRRVYGFAVAYGAEATHIKDGGGPGAGQRRNCRPRAPRQHRRRD